MTPEKKDWASASDREIQEAIDNRTEMPPVPVPDPGDGNQNQFREPSGTSRTAPVFESAAEFLERAQNAPPFEWLIEGAVPKAGNVLLVAAPNAGKTWFALAIAKEALLQKRDVFFVEEEGGLASFGERIQALRFDNLDRLNIAFRYGFDLGEPDHMSHLLELAKSHEAPVFIIDPFSSVFLGDENDAGPIKVVTRRLSKALAANPRALLVILHHTSKSGGTNTPDKMTASRGSGALNGWADTQLNLAELTNENSAPVIRFKLFQPKVRDAKKHGERVGEINLETGEVCFSDAPGGSNSSRGAAIIAFVRQSQAAVSRNAIAKHVGGNKQAALAAIGSLVVAGRLEDSGEGIRVPSGSAPEAA